MIRLTGSPEGPGAYAYIALGSNLGDSRQNIIRAVRDLARLSEEPLLASSLWETAPVDCPPGSPMFLNAVVRVLPRANEDSESLLLKLQELERRYGRGTKQVLNEARPMDLDLILFGGEIRMTKHLVIPHPRAISRRFVLEPLNEIAPGMLFPGQDRTVAELLAALPADHSMRRLDKIQISPA